MRTIFNINVVQATICHHFYYSICRINIYFLGHEDHNMDDDSDHDKEICLDFSILTNLGCRKVNSITSTALENGLRQNILKSPFVTSSVSNNQSVEEDIVPCDPCCVKLNTASSLKNLCLNTKLMRNKVEILKGRMFNLKLFSFNSF